MAEVRVLAAADEPGWAALVARHPHALLYHGLPYRDLLVDHLGCETEYLVAIEGGDARGALPVMWATSGGARIANSLPFYGSHGGVLAESPAAAAALLDAWDERARDPGTAAATLVENPFGALPRLPERDLGDERLNHATPLGSPATALGRIEASAARNVRKAARLGIRVAREPGALGELAAIHAANMAAIGGRAKDPGFFAAIPRHVGAPESFDVYTARRDGQLAAALLVFWTPRVAEYFTPAIVAEHRSAQPLAAILARVLPDAARRGCAWLNWGGTWLTQDSLRRFKRKWGAREVRYRYHTAVNDRALLDTPPEELRRRFGHFYVAPYGAGMLPDPWPASSSSAPAASPSSPASTSSTTAPTPSSPSR